VTARWLVRLYPAAWRERYGAELEELIDRQPASPPVVLDLLLGALDAHVHPELGPTAATPDGVLWIFACHPTRGVWFASAATLVAMVGLAWLRRTFGFNFVLDLLYFGAIGLGDITSSFGPRQRCRTLVGRRRLARPARRPTEIGARLLQRVVGRRVGVHRGDRCWLDLDAHQDRYATGDRGDRSATGSSIRALAVEASAGHA
jgi:hypothetical protein